MVLNLVLYNLKTFSVLEFFSVSSAAAPEILAVKDLYFWASIKEYASVRVKKKKPFYPSTYTYLMFYGAQFFSLQSSNLRSARTSYLALFLIVGIYLICLIINILVVELGTNALVLLLNHSI